MKRLRILKYPWHTGHDYELCKLPHDFCFLESTTRVWATEQRPVPDSIHWVPSIDSEPTDVMILHLDQWSFQEPAKRFLYQWHRDRYPGPKIVILHGAATNDGMTREQLKDLVGPLPVVCNSKAALSSWDIPNARYIRHGMSVDEWSPSDYSIHNILVVQAFQTRHKSVRNTRGVKLAEERVPITWVGRDIHFQSFEHYRYFLSRSSIFFNPSFSSANPRSRTEAMLSGLAVVTTNSNGEDEYIENGVNGYCSNDMEELIQYLEQLYADPKLVRSIGSKGRETAQSLFHLDQFQAQWDELLHEVCEGGTI